MTVVIKLRGLPWSATANEIREFFRGLSLREEDIHLAPSKDGKASGIGFAIFHSDEDARKAMFRNGKYIGNRYVELALSSMSEMDKFLQEGVSGKRKQPLESENFDETRWRDAGRGRDRMNGLGRRSRSPVDRYRGNGDIDRISEGRRFVAGERLLEKGRFERDRNEHIYSHERERENVRYSFDRAESTVHGAWQNDSDRERRKGEREVRSRRDNRPNGEQRDTLESPAPLSCVRVIGLPFDVQEGDVEKFFEGLHIVGIHFLRHKEGKFIGRPNGWGYVEFRSLGDSIHAESRNHQFIGKRYVEVKRCSKEQMIREIIASGAKWEDGGQQIAGMNSTERGDNYGRYEQEASPSPDPVMSAMLSGGMSNFIGRQPLAMENNQAAMMMQLAAGANVSANDIQSGCVVGIRNLPSSITAEEILDFFYGFPVAPDSIRIHYLAPGRSSGDAMVTLPTAPDAVSAIDQLNHKPVGRRNVQLFLI